MTSTPTLRTNLSYLYTRDPNNKLFPEAAVDLALQQGYEATQRALGWWFMEEDQEYTVPIVAWTYEYALPSDFAVMSNVVYNGLNLSATTKKDIRTSNISLTSTGTPYWYYLFDGNLGLHPVPQASDTCVMTYHRTLPTLSTSQASLLPSRADKCTLSYAAYTLWLPIDPNKAQVWKNTFDIYIDEVRLEGLGNDENVAFTVSRWWPYVGPKTLP